MAQAPKRKDPAADETPAARPRPRAVAGRSSTLVSRGRRWGARHVLAAVAIALAVLLLVVVFGSFLFDGPLRSTLESRINQHLKGYRVTLGHAHFQPLGLRLTLRSLTIRQIANPEPPVADFPGMRATIEWTALLRLRLVGDWRFARPRLHVDLTQLRREAADKISLKDRGWQQALESIYPLKLNHIAVDDGDVVYVDEDAEHPLHLSHLQLAAENIRNIQSRDRVYPSPIHAEAVVFDTGRATLDGNADFLAVPFPGVHAVYHVAAAPLARLRPIAQRGNVVIRAGDLSSQGEVEYSPKVKVAHVATVTIAGLKLDYLHTAATAEAEKARGEKVAAAARKVSVAPGLDLRVDRLAVTDGELGLVDRAQKPGYRVYLDRVQVALEHLSNASGPALVEVSGRFMGSQGNGAARATARFKEREKGPDLDLDAAIENASLPAANDLLRTYVHFDVARGTASVYAQLHIHDGRIEGYVKPLLQGVQVYDPKQDREKSLGEKIKEKLANVAAKVLTNRQRHDVATVADLSGPANNPRTSVWQIALKAIENAFVKAIVPGFEKTYGPQHDKK